MEVKHKLRWQRTLVNSLFLILGDAIIVMIAAFYLELGVLAFPLVMIRMMALFALFPVTFLGFNMLFRSPVVAYMCTFLLIYLSVAVIGSFLSPRGAEIFEVFVGLHSKIDFYALSYLPFVISFCVTYLLDLTMLDK